MEIEHVVTGYDEDFIYGRTLVDGAAFGNWMKFTPEAHDKYLWGLKPIGENTKAMGIGSIDAKKSKYLDDTFSDKNRILEYIGETCSNQKELDQVVNWLIGPIKQVLTECEISEDDIEWVFPIRKLNYLLSEISKDTFIKSKSKEAVIYMATNELLSEEFYAADVDYDTLADKIISDNLDMISKKGMKVSNWIVGQIMKETQGKADAAKAREVVTKKMEKFE